jgi:hypothetical protein
MWIAYNLDEQGFQPFARPDLFDLIRSLTATPITQRTNDRAIYIQLISFFLVFPISLKPRMFAHLAS